ncbi:MAG: STAS domain-containing protein [Solirubrobacteraceae bacterium]
MMTQLEITETADPDGPIRVALTGELDLAVCERVRARLMELSAAGAAVRLDLRRLEFIDSSGLQLLLSMAVQARGSDWSFEVDHDVGHAVRRTIELVGAGSVLWASRGRAPDP